MEKSLIPCRILKDVSTFWDNLYLFYTLLFQLVSCCYTSFELVPGSFILLLLLYFHYYFYPTIYLLYYLRCYFFARHIIHPKSPDVFESRTQSRPSPDPRSAPELWVILKKMSERSASDEI